MQRLAIQLPNQQSITFQDGDNLQSIVNHTNGSMTTLTAWFQENSENTAAHEFKYTDFPLHYTWNKTHSKCIYEKLQQKQLVDFIWYNLQKEKDIICESY